MRYFKDSIDGSLYEVYANGNIKCYRCDVNCGAMEESGFVNKGYGCGINLDDIENNSSVIKELTKEEFFCYLI